jgi:hypothetical protein
LDTYYEREMGKKDEQREKGDRGEPEQGRVMTDETGKRMRGVRDGRRAR